MSETPTMANRGPRRGAQVRNRIRSRLAHISDVLALFVLLLAVGLGATANYAAGEHKQLNHLQQEVTQLHQQIGTGKR